MPATLPLLILAGAWLFALGTVVGSFLNVCIYRIPWEKSVIWPGSHCFKCWTAIAARDNIPILGWLLLRGRCRCCKAPISIRYPFVEALVGGFFVALFVLEVVHAPRAWRGEVPSYLFATWFYHAALISLLVAGTFIDYDLTIIPDEIPISGVIVALSLGSAYPWIRPEPAIAATPWAGFWMGVTGLLVGGGITQSVRFVGTLAFRREAMGAGDVTLMAMIGAFLGWQAALLTFFLAPFFGIAHAVWKMAQYVLKRMAGGKLTSADREIPFGPYLSMAAVTLVLSWPWVWSGWARDFFALLGVVSLWLLGLEK